MEITKRASSLEGAAAGTRFPRSMLPHEAAERLLLFLGVEIVDDCDAELKDYARAWLATVPPKEDWKSRPSTRAVERALRRSSS